MLVSIIIPAYNAEKYIARAIKSALNQTYKDIEVIVVDDGSTDRTAEIVKSFQDPRVRYIYQENQNVGVARNNGIKESRGKYITFLDADDEYLPEKVEKQVKFLKENPQYQAVYCDTLQFYSDAPDKFLKSIEYHPSGDIFEALLHSSLINLNSFMATKELLLKVGMFDPRPNFPEDWELWLRIAKAGYKFGHIHEGLVKVEMRKDSKTTSEVNFQAKKYLLEVFENLFSSMSPEEREKYKTSEIIQDLKWKMAIVCLLNNNMEELAKISQEISPVKKLFIMGLRLIPVSLRKSLLEYLWRRYQRRRWKEI